MNCPHCGKPIAKMLDNLTPTQRRRYEKYFNGKTYTAIAKSEGVSVEAVRRTIIQVEKRLKRRVIR